MAASEVSSDAPATAPLTRPLKRNTPSAPHSPIATVRPVAWPAMPRTPFFSRKATDDVRKTSHVDTHRYSATKTPYTQTLAAEQRGRQLTPPPYSQPAPQYAQPAPQYGQPTPPKIVSPKPCEGVRIVARVGQSIILEREVMGVVNSILKANKDRIPPEHIDQQRRILFRQALKQHVDNKLVYEDAIRSLPEEAIPNIEAQLTQHFEEKQITAMMKRAKVNSRHELDEKLKRQESSLDIEKRAFMERSLAMQWVRQKINSEEEITHEQRLAYYHENLADFEQPARVRWEQLSVHFNKYPSDEEASIALARMGNQVIDSVPFEEVAKAGSNGSTSLEGGRHDWTHRDSLKSEVLDKAIFSLPVGQLSPILKDERGLHILRVVERREQTRTPFVETQSEIQEKIRKKRMEGKKDEYLARLRKELPVWTVFDTQKQNGSLSGRPNTTRR